jgi:peptidyl-prolyl cis-trans isomerase D
MNFKFIEKKYADVADSTVKVTEEEMRNYYNANAYKFKQRDNNRSMEYVAFDILPSANDIAEQRKDMEKTAGDFRAQKTAKDDSLFVVATTASGMYEKKYLHAGQYPAGTDSAFIKAQKGEVLGPYNQGENLAIYKVIDHKLSADSAKVRHILIAYKGADRADPSITRTDAQAKAKADSLLRAIKGGKKMEDLVEKFTDDPGSKSGNKGDYGWFTEESGFVQEFKDAGFKNPIGAIVVVKTSFGYHVIQVLDRTKESPKTQVIAIEKKLEPSETTIREAYNKASEFSGKNNTGDLFTKAVQKDGLNVLKADNVTEGSKYIAGIENPRDISRWMYDEKTEVGSVSSPFQNGDRYIVCHLTKILNKGTKPFEEVKEICELEARKIKKAQMFIDELTKKRGNSLDQWATNAGLPVMTGAPVTFAQPYIQGAGYEGAVVGTLANMKPGQLSAPIKGSMGVYVVLLESVTQAEPIKDIAGQKTKIMQGLASRVDGSAMEILKDDANITDNRAKHF